MAKLPNYDQNTLQQLAERTQYERWLLEAVYTITEQKINLADSDLLTYFCWNADFSQSVQVVIGKASLGDWRPGFLNAGAPLVFVSAFKLLDMLMEWVIEANGHKVDFKFSKKLDQLKKNPRFPPSIESRIWLKQRLLGLYKTLEPYRGTVIHHNQFVSTNGHLEVTTTKKQLPPTTLCISPEQLRALAQVVVGTICFIDGTWTLAHYQEKMLRFQLDKLLPLHCNPALLQCRPCHVSVRYYQLKDKNSVDLARIQQDLARRFPKQDISFDLTLVWVFEQQATAAFLFSWDVIHAMAGVWDQCIDLQNYSTEIPTGIDLKHLNMPASENA